ncbi:MAG: thioredoxin-disulfide reductase [Clostridiaceae bacterium]|nr:thioredoxin-disulfide reductase [Clostridiaceae bacterium]
MYDVIIIGGGPAGYTAALYSARARLKTLVIEKMFSGGQIATTDSMENYPGFDEPVGGVELALRMENQARKFGAEILYDEVIDMDLAGKVKIVKTTSHTYNCKALILCMGASPKSLGLDKEGALRGLGVSYCSVCDAAFYKGKKVAVVGGGNSAADDALYLTKYAEKVYLIHRRDNLRCVKMAQEELFKSDKIDFVFNSQVVELLGERKLEGIRGKNSKTNETSTLYIDGLFIAIGLVPNNELVLGKLELSKDGYIITDRNMKTSVEGVFAAGDICEKPLRQVVTAASDGAVAAYSAEKYVTQYNP